MTRVLAACFVFLLSACAGRLDRPRPLTAKDVEQHQALAPDDHRGRARFAFDLGLRTDAIFHATQWLEQSQTRALIADATSVGATERREAGRDLDRAIEQAIATGRRFGEGTLVIDASLARSRPKLADLAWGCQHTDYWYGDHAALLEATSKDPEAWLAAWALVERWATSEEGRGYTPPGAVLRKLGTRANGVRWTLLTEELKSGALSQRAVELAATIAEHDPTDLRAHIVLALRDAMKDGTFVPDADVFGDETTLWINASSLSRARRRAETYADAPAVQLHHAHLLLASGLSGDALAVLEASESRWTSDTQRDIAALIEALARVHAGRPEAYEAWLARHDGAATLAADRLLERWRASTMGYGEVPALDTPLGAALADALTRRVEQRDPRLRETELVRAMATGDLSRRERAWVRDQLGTYYVFVEHCLEGGGEPVDCASIVVTPWTRSGWILAEFGVDHVAADEMFTWLQTDTLDTRARRALDEARGTTLALSSTFTSSYVRALIELGELEEADAWLDRFGASLSADRLGGLQLTLADHLAGRTDDIPYTVLVSDWPADPGTGEGYAYETPNSEASWVAKLQTAEVHVFERNFAKAEALYAEVADGAPEPARGVLLGLAARAAFEAGDTAGARAHLSSVRADTPERREVEALLAAGDGDTDGARRALLDLWPQRRSASQHLLRLGVSLQTEPALEAFAKHGALSWAVQEAVDEGSITDLKGLAAAEVLAEEPSRAWDEASTLVPGMVSLAVGHGYELLRASTRADDARPIAIRLLELQQRKTQPPRDQIMELMLLTGQHDEALSMARSEIPEAGIVPLASTDGLVRLHQAGRAGTVTAEALWHEWRWRSDLGGAEEHDALLDRARGPLLGYACMLLSDLPNDPRALPTCKKAWEAEKNDSWQSAVNYTYLLLQQDVPPPGILAMVFESTPPPPYQPAGAPLRDRADVAILHQNLAAWLSLGGEHERAAQASIDGYAFARASNLSENNVPEVEYPTRSEHAHMGTLRSRGADVATLYGRLAYQALRALRPRVAAHYADVSAALPISDEHIGGPLAAARARALAPMMADDLEANHIPADALGGVVAAAYSSDDVTEFLAPVFTAHPDSAFVRVLMAESDSEEGRTELALERLEPLEAAYPANDLVAIVGAKARVVSGDVEGAKARYAQAFAARPESLLLVHAELTEEIVGARPNVPGWLRSAEAFDGRLSSVSTREMMDLVPRYQSHTEVGADGFFPLAWESRDGPMSAESSLGAWVSVEQDARASRCVGEECIRDTVDSLERRGYTTHFVRTTEIPAGTATEAALSDATQTWLMTSVPLGGRVFTLLGSAPHSQAESLVTAFALLRQSFAPLDAVVPSFAAASLRADGSKLVDRTRLRARLEAGAAAGEGCPVRATMGEATALASAEIVLDLYLASAEADRRHDVLSCVKPGSRAARRLALAALLDDDARLHDWGTLAVQHHPSRAIADTKHLIPMGIPLSAPDYFDRQEASPRGRIELGLNLPEVSAKRWMASLLSGRDADARIDAWVIASQRPAVADLDEAERTAREAEPGIAFLAFDVLEHRDMPRFAAAVRTRLDALDPETLPEDRFWEARALGYGLVELAEAEDGPRLKAAAKRFEGKTKRRKAMAKTLRRFAEWHAEARSSEQSGADPFHAAQRADAKRARAPRTRKELETAPLAKLLPTRHWTFARVASPGLFASTVLDLTQRLEPGDPTQRLMVDRAVESMRQANGFDALLDGGGLDLSAPIECAGMAGDSGFVCSATVADREALLTELGRRGYGSDAGLAIVLRLSNGTGLLPVGLSVLPALLHQIVYDAIDDDDDSEPRDPKDRRYERLRHRVSVAGHPLEYYAIIEAEDGSVGTDAERYLFLGDRVFVFSNDFMARRILFQPESGTPSLGDDPEFIALTRDWKDGSALQAAFMGLSSPIDDASVASEVVADGKGIAFRYSATADAKISDMTNAEAHLPPGSVSTLVVGYPEQTDDDDLPELAELKLAAGDVVPPIGLLMVSSGAAFGWYPAPGDSLWKQWVLVLPQNKTLAKAAKKEGIRSASKTPKQSKSAWWYGEVDGLLVLASDEHLARLAVERASAPKGGTQLLGRGTFDGDQASKVVARLPTTSPDLERMVLRFFAGIIGIVEDVGFEATWDPSTRVGSMQGRISLRLRDRDATEVVDQWLAAARFRNAAALPRSLSADEAEGTLRFSLAVGDANAFADQSVFPSARVSTRVVDDTHIELTVRAKALDKDATEALTESREKALLDTSNALRIHDPAIEKIRDTLTKPSMTPTDKAKAITAWVHERIAYEVTPRSIDATEILEVGRGDCSEYSRLSVSLLRAAGVPAEVRSGMAAQGSDMVAHAWVAYHDGVRWHEVDPTWGRMSVTAGHLPLEVTDVLALISLNQLEIETIEAVK